MSAAKKDSDSVCKSPRGGWGVGGREKGGGGGGGEEGVHLARGLAR